MARAKPAKSKSHSIPYALDAALRTIANYSVERVDDPGPSEETFEHCKVCNEWEGHTETCPVPMIKAFYASA